jgi:peptidoglycan/LPS O-acetylase OafA/YrhL
MTDPAPPAPDRGYVPALDGLRAGAVVAVMAYHGGVPGAQGGFLGVDVFFVLSGFLITSLLLAEDAATGRIDLARFWARRARRLLPALLLMLGAVAAYAAFVAAPGDRLDIRRAGLATLGYVANWAQAFGGQGYFARLAAPSPLLHTWSLAIEEQFYLVWPLVVTGLLWCGRRRRSGRDLLPLLGVALVGAAASAGAMALLYRAGAGTNRVYYGTDTRAQDLLVGAALAVIMAAVHRRRWESGGRSGAHTATAPITAVGTAAAAAVVAAVVTASGSSGWLYRGGYLAVAGATALVLACVTLAPTGALARGLALRPLPGVGRISYGLYLWHWPVYLILDGARTGLRSWPLLAVRVAVTAAVSLASYHLVEMPVRRGALTRWRTVVGLPLAAGAVAAGLVVATVVPAGAVVPSIAGAAGLAPGTGSDLPAVAAGAGGPTRVLLVGDSLATSLALGITAAPRYRLDVAADTVIGCGLVVTGLVANRGVVAPESGGLRGAQWVRCATWPQRWAADVATFHPSLAVVLVGPWEVRDRLLGGSWVHIGQPGYDALELAALRRAVRVLSGGRTQVVLLTCPYFSQPEQADGSPQSADAPARVDRFNNLLRLVAATSATPVRVLDLGRLLSPGGHYAASIRGLQVRAADGLHLTVAGAGYVQRWLLPRLAAMSTARNLPVSAGPERRAGT